MLTSIAIMFLLSIVIGGIFKKIHLPALIGMIITGMILSPYALNLIDDSILSISSELRSAALVIILTRAGLSLDISDLKQVGRPAVLMCFVPAVFEMIGFIVLAPPLLGVSRLDAAIMGAVIAAVSPAVIVPGMLKIISGGYGEKHKIGELILAGASVDDIFVVVVFSVLTTLAKTGDFSALSFLQIPVSVVLGILLGVAAGAVLVFIFKKIHMRDSVKLIIILSISFLFLEAEDRLEGIVPVSGLLAVMSTAVFINRKYPELAKRLSGKYNKLWVAAEIVLFVLVGATVNLKYAAAAGIGAVVLILGALVFRTIGVQACLIKTPLTKKERIFCSIAYTPKATVQAAIGSVPLAMGLACGEQTLAVAVLAILITAPLGSFCIDLTYKKLLDKECKKSG